MSGLFAQYNFAAAQPNGKQQKVAQSTDENAPPVLEHNGTKYYLWSDGVYRETSDTSMSVSDRTETSIAGTVTSMTATSVTAASATDSSLAQHLVLYYLPVRARAETARMMLHYANVIFEDQVLDFKTFNDEQSTHKYPFDQLPVLDVNGVQIAQCGPIARLCADLAGLRPSDPVEAARIDMVADYAMEMNTLNPIANKFNTDKEDIYLTVDKCMEKLPFLEEQLKGNFYGGSRPSLADFEVWHHMDQLEAVAPGAMNQHPRLKELSARVAALPGVKEYLATRSPIV